MLITVKTRELELNERLRDYVEKKVQRLNRYLPNIMEARVELAKESTRNAQQRHTAQITLFASNGRILRAEERDADIYAAFDAVMDTIERQIERYKGKHWLQVRPRRRGEMRALAEAEALAELEAAEDAEEDFPPQIKRVKRFEMVPMDEWEAIEQMELLGHDFFVFYNVNTNSVNVLYRRKEGGYGLIIPELA
ncbi:MAG: ribosome-associated translation inhibitor RaiA [Chloroflexi bacterium]|nr:ribosome-associated translation inhibitor RaiA [Chloroflexota bacterium]